MLKNSMLRLLRTHLTASMMTVSVCFSISSCSNDASTSQEYQNACYGEPLLTIEQRNQALEDGYTINQQYKCIDINSYRAMQEAQAQREAARSPEALAQKKAEDEAHDARNAQQRQIRQAEKDAKRALRYELRLVEINTASTAELAKVCSIREETAEKIVKERINGGQFKDWVDVMHRVIALSSAQNVLYASTCGLVVNGASFDGVPANEEKAQMIFQQYLR